MKRAALVLLALLTAKLPAAADDPAPWPGAHWYLEKTDRGCYYYEPTAASPAEEAKQRRTWYFSITWEGRCTPGKLINGSGTMVEVGNLMATSGKPGRSFDRYRGTMVNGLWNGEVVHTDQYPGMPAGTYDPRYPVMGCTPNMAGDKNNTCRPPNPPPALLESTSEGK